MKTLNQLKTQAKKHDLSIRKDGHGNFMLVDNRTNTVAAYPELMTLEEVEQWLDDLDTNEGTDD